MNHPTFDRFQGVWLGSFIGAMLTQQDSKHKQSNENQILGNGLFDWLETRERIARLIIAQDNIEFNLPQIIELLLNDPKHNPISESLARSVSNTTTNKSIIIRCRLLFVLLSLMIFQEDNQYAYTQYFDLVRSEIDSLNTAELINDLIAWNYLIGLVIKNPTLFQDVNIDTTFEQILNSSAIQTTSLVNKLQVVNQGWKDSWSLQKLWKRLSQSNNIERNTTSTASLVIAASFYCFVSTPQNFMLSVKRASKIDNQLSSAIAVFTASISGAYNGIGGIPRDWIKLANRHRTYQQAQQTIQKLHKIWLGIHCDSDSLELLYDSQINAIDFPGNIQFRQSLKIISQQYNQH